MTNEKYKTLLNKIQGESKKIRLEPSDEIIEIKANVFSFYEQYLQNIQNFRVLSMTAGNLILCMKLLHLMAQIL